MSKSKEFPIAMSVVNSTHVVTHRYSPTVSIEMTVLPTGERRFALVENGQHFDLLDKEDWARHRAIHAGSLVPPGAVYIGGFPEYREVTKNLSDRYDRVISMCDISFGGAE